MLLYCILPYCIVLASLYCIALYVLVLYCIELACIVLHCIVLYCIVLSRIVLASLYCRRLGGESEGVPNREVEFRVASLRFALRVVRDVRACGACERATSRARATDQ